MGARLLLVEDCPLNQEVALDLLQSAGMAVDLAKNGRSDIDKVRMNAYDLVLMDLQMPEMDGIEATREIRALAGLERLPIIAMTANAFTEHRNVCLSVGMKDFIAKPVDPETLYSKLLYWLSRPDQKPAPADDAGQTHERLTNDFGRLSAFNPELPSQLASISGLDVRQGLAYVKGDTTKYKHLLSLFADLHSQDMKRIQAWLADGNVQEARRLTHELTNASAIIGANRVSDFAAQLESAFYIHAPTQECMDIANLCDNELTQLSQAVFNALPIAAV
jgi:CheY-like chemotaxis protein